MIRAVAFDLDDTLAVTTRSREAILERAASQAGVSLTFDREDYIEAHRRHSGTESRRPVFEALVEEDAAALTKAYRETVGDALEPAWGAIEAVAKLRDRYPVGLLTDGPETTQRDKLHRLGWTDAFDEVVVTGAIDAPKPDPTGFEVLCDRLEAPPGQTVYVGDNPDRDITGANAAGLVPIQVMYGGGPTAHPDAAAEIPRTELSALPGVLEELVGDGADDS